VAYFNSNKPAWKRDAKTGYINQELTKWVDGLISTYEVKGLNRIKDQVKTKDESTAAETTAPAVTA
jgi:hypothetical protein